MKIKNIILAMAVLAFSSTSCSDDNDNDSNINRGAIRFNTSITGSVDTRASGTTWGVSDVVGIYMKKAGQDLADQNIINNSANKKHTTPGDGVFSAATNAHALYYPTDGSKVDFISYYPYKETLTNYVYNVDVSTQTSQEAIDFLYSNNAVNQDKSGSVVSLNFDHKLAKIVFNIKAGTGIPSLTGLSIKISGMKKTADFSLASGVLTLTGDAGDIIAKTTASGAEVVGEAIVLPADAVAGRTITFTLPSGSFKWDIPASVKYESGKKYTYDVELKNTGVVLPNGTISDWTTGSSETIELENGQEGENETGDGSKANPYTVTQALTKVGEAGKWIDGYIVGVSTVARSGNFGAPFTQKTNILIAATAGEVDFSKCLPIELIDGSDIQASLNLVDNPTLLGKQIKVQGDLIATLFGSPVGLSNVTAQEGGAEVNPGPGVTKEFFNETFGVTTSKDEKAKIGVYTKYIMKDPVSYSDPYGTWADVRTSASLLDTYNMHVWLPAFGTDKESGLLIQGIEGGYSDITLSYDIATNGASGADANIIIVKCNDVPVSIPSLVLEKQNEFKTVTVSIPNNTTKLEFYSGANNTLGFRLDNIKLVGTK